MINNIKIYFALILLFLISTAVVRSEPILIGGDFNYAPFEYLNEQGEPEGFNIDLINAIAKNQKLNIKIILGEWKNILEKLDKGEIDLIVGMSYSETRDLKFDFSVPTYHHTTSIFIRKRSPITGLVDLNNKKILVQKSDIAENFITQNGITQSLITLPTIEEALIRFNSGEGDALLANSAVGIYHIKKNNIANVTMISTPVLNNNYCMATVNGDPKKLLMKTNEGLIYLIKNGDYDSLRMKWFGSSDFSNTSYNQKIVFYRIILISSFIILSLLTFLIIWLRKSLIDRKKSESHYKAIIDDQTELICRISPDGIINFTNSNFNKYYENKNKNLNGYDWHFLIPSDIRYQIDDRLMNISPENPHFNLEFRDSGKNGEDCHWLSCIIRGIFSSKGELNEYQIICRDITEKKNVEYEKKSLEWQLLQTQKLEAIGMLSSGLAHDFNNIITGINGTISLIKISMANKSLNDEKLNNYLNLMENSSLNASEVIKRLLTLSRKNEINLSDINIVDIINNVIKICCNTFDQNITINTELHYDEAYIHGDATLLEQVILSICINALHAMTIMRPESETAHGEMKIELDYTENNNLFQDQINKNNWKITITDTGVGMTQDELYKIFNPFYTRKPKGVGYGLGLSIAYNIIKQHNGHIDVDSSVGKGSKFTIYLPAQNKTVKTPCANNYAVTETTSQIPDSGAILVIDDEEIVRKIATELLTLMGHYVITAEDGIAGLEIFQAYTDKIKLVILDMVMPRLCGRDTFYELKKINPLIKIIVSSGFRQDERVQEILHSGAFGFMPKPYELNTLSNMLEAALKNR